MSTQRGSPLQKAGECVHELPWYCLLDTERQHSMYHVDLVVLSEPAGHLGYDGTFLDCEPLRGRALLLLAGK